MASLRKELETYRRNIADRKFSCETKRLEKLQSMQERLRSGETTRDEIADFSILYANAEQEAESAVRNVYDQISNNNGNLILVETHYSSHRMTSRISKHQLDSCNKKYLTNMQIGIIQEPFIDLAQENEEVKYPRIKIVAKNVISICANRQMPHNYNYFSNVSMDAGENGINFRLFLLMNVLNGNLRRLLPLNYNAVRGFSEMPDSAVQFEDFYLLIGDRTIKNLFASITMKENSGKTDEKNKEGSEFYKELEEIISDDAKFNEFKERITRKTA